MEMEAEIFEDICRTLEEKKVTPLKLPIRNRSPILKTLWTTFTTFGPQLKFVWEADYNVNSCESNSSTFLDTNHKLSEEGSTNSSLSRNTESTKDQYEDIEPITSNELIGDSHFTPDDLFLTKELDHYRGMQQSFEIPDSSVNSAGGTNSTFTFCNSQATTPLSQIKNQTKTDYEKLNPIHKRSVENQKPFCVSHSHPSSRSFSTVSDEESSTVDEGSYKKVSNSQLNCDLNPNLLDSNSLFFASESYKKNSSKNNAPMVTSCVDSGIANTISMESELSSLCVGVIASPSSSQLSLSNQQQLPTFVHSPQNHVVHYNAIDDRCNIVNRNIVCTPKENRLADENTNPTLNNRSDFCTSIGPFSDDDENLEFKRFMEQPHCSRFTESRFTLQSSVFSSSSFMFDSPKKDITRLNDERRDLLDFYEDSQIISELIKTNFTSSEPKPDEIGVSQLSLSDEEFVNRYVLAEQVCSTQLSSNPLIHKFQLVPSRNIAVGSFIFCFQKGQRKRIRTNSYNSDSDGENTDGSSLSALSLIFSLEMADWYLNRFKVILEFFTDIVSLFKASIKVDLSIDVISFLTREFSLLFDYFGALDSSPLTGQELTSIKIKSSHLWDLRKPAPSEFHFLSKCITACLISQGCCTIVGANSDEVHKLMLTLSLFLNNRDRLFCLKPYALPFSPYLRLQAIKRSDLEYFYSEASASHWPISLIDLDRRSVTYSAPYPKHIALKMTFLRHKISQIFNDARENRCSQQKLSREPTLGMQMVHVSELVSEFLDAIFLLPQRRVARYAYLDHFHLRLDNHARALIQFVQEMSLPQHFSSLKDDKRSAIALRWSLTNARRALGLLGDASFGICLARAESLCPEFADFIVQSSILKNLYGS